jgi:endonuclease/exonuclease/phosphatase (EEP) superfamily protein YafD
MDLSAARRLLPHRGSGAAGPPPPRRRWRPVVIVTGALFALAAIIGVVGHFRAPHRADVIGVSAFAPYLMLGAPMAVVLFAFARQWIVAVLAVALTVLAGSTQVRLHVAATGLADATTIVTMTSNLRLGEADPTRVIAAVRTHHVDVLMLEELTPEEQTRLLDAGLGTLLPFHVSDPRPIAQGTGLWSRYPLSDPTRRTDFTFAFVTARVTIPGVAGQPLLVATHMAGPVPDSADWNHDIARLPGVLAALDPTSPALVGGDFNATPDIAQFRRVLAAGFHDGAQQAGAGMTRTYPSDTWYPPLIAIDHVLTRGAVARTAETVEIAGSDHRALVVTVQLPKAGPTGS